MQMNSPKPRRGGVVAPAPAAARATVPRFIITVSIAGSTGPLKLMVGGGDLSSAVIAAALKMHASGGRLPQLGSDACNFVLYTPDAGTEGFKALSPCETIGSHGSRRFLLYKKEGVETATAPPVTPKTPLQFLSRKRCPNWKAWLNRSFHSKVSSH